MTLKFLLVAVLAVVCTCNFYDNNQNIQQITAQNFDKLQKGVWLVEFYRVTCSHCRQFAPTFEKIADALHEVVQIGAFDTTKPWPETL